ncbi:MAG: DNA methyltransferase [Thermodesulfovibrionales bacterium]|nr:DNA methyltransferase [Thermodesulfovibrionales bacterium]
MNWAGKSDAFKILQQPTTATLKPAPEESVNFDTTGNLFIEGENLEVLKVLQKAYYGKVKCIIIDPPYNTGSDSFIYPDKFSEKKEDYLKRIGDKDEEGFLMKEGLFRKNSKDSGHYHSNWLSMMYPRLFLAKNLLRDDGVIFIHIDDNEVHNLRMVMNEIFGEENFVAQFVWQKRKGGGNDSAFIAVDHEYIFCFAKNKLAHIDKWRVPYEAEYLKRYKEEDKEGKYYWDTLSRDGLQSPIIYDVICPDNTIIESGKWQVAEKTFYDKKEKGEIKFVKSKDGGWTVMHKVRQPDGKTFRSVISNITNSDAATEMNSIFANQKIFDNPKPSFLIKKLIQISGNQNDIILDFFGGSSTTAHAVLELNQEDGGNRKFILVQMPEPCDENSEAYKAGYKTIADIAKERIRRVIKRLTPNPSPEKEGGYKDTLFKGAKPTLFENAGSLRKAQTEAEEKLWQALRNKKINNCKFRRQHPIGQFIADFYCHEAGLIIEVDGGYHNKADQKTYDEARTQVINDFGVKVIRFTNEEILSNLTEVVKKVSEVLQLLSPSPLGEGAGGEVGFKVFKLSPSSFKIWRGAEIDSEEKLVQQLDAFTNPIKPGAEKQNMLYELMLKAGYELTSPLTPLLKERGTDNDDAPSPQGEGWGEVYSINNNELIIALDEMNEKLIEQIIAAKPQKVITLDSLFTGNDQLKTNTVLQMRDAGVDFKTI